MKNFHKIFTGKKLFIIILLSVGLCPVFSQGKIDSLQKVLNAHKQNDTTKIIQLHEFARTCFLDELFEKGYLALKQAEQLASKLNYKKEPTLYWRTMAIFHVDTELYKYYNWKSVWSYTDTIDKENAVTFAPDWEVRVTSQKKNDKRIEAVNYFEKQQDEKATAYLLYDIATYYLNSNNLPESLSYLNKSLALFKQMNDTSLMVYALCQKMYLLDATGKKQESIDTDSAVTKIINGINDIRESALLTLELCYYYNYFFDKRLIAIEKELRTENVLEAAGDEEIRIIILEDLAVNFGFLGMSQKSIEYYKRGIALREKNHDYDDARRIYFNLGFELVNVREFKDANAFFSKAKTLSNKQHSESVRQGERLRYADAMGQIAMGEGKYAEALDIFNKGANNGYVFYYKAYCYQKMKNLKESIKYGEQSNKIVIDYGDQRLMIKLYLLLSEVYNENKQLLKAYEYLKKYRAVIKQREDDDIANHSANLEIQSIIEKSERQKDLLAKEKLVKEKENQNQRWWLVSITGALLSAFVLLFVFYRNNSNKNKANALLQLQKEEIQTTLSQLKSTQAQLIQSEKMASLGELTAGIAHEIQNPLNFVNNFSDVNKELLEELKEEAAKGNIDEVKAIANDVIGNEEKINNHGKRADAIVKGMLQHSRQTAGTNELTDINVLCDEYLRLSYHGLRAKDKSFNANFKTDFDESIGKINIVPQDIGRVLLNLINNAFYTVNEKKKLANENYEPLVFVQTKKVNNKIEIKVEDNGNGIPQSIIDKIFQPFFTTKPTGQGTGLGLSLAYDIITKEHNGSIKVESKESEGSVFIIQLPTI